MEEQITGTPLTVTGESHSEWSVNGTLQELEGLLGLQLLVEFCRCSVAADRLTSLGDFALFNEEWTPRLEIAHSRNLQTMFWLTCGTLHEAIYSLSEMEVLGIEGLLGSFEARKPWIELRAKANRWKDDPNYQRVRNRIAFHFDGNAIRKAIRRTAGEETVVWKKGNTKKDRSSLFVFAEDCLVSNVLPAALSEMETQRQFGHLAETVRDAHLGFSHWTQELFIAALRGAGRGLKLTPLERPRLAGLQPERLQELTDLADDTTEADHRSALSDLLAEVRRLSTALKRTDNDTTETAERRRTTDERTLQSIAATSRQFLLEKAPAAEARLRELLGLEPLGEL